MANVLIDENTLKAIADAIRNVNGETTAYFPKEMVDAINEILDSATYILVDENGNEAIGVMVDNETLFDATANDIREGKVAATSEGVTVGTKVIPSYNTTEGIKIIPAGQLMTVKLKHYDYTQFQGIICPFNTSADNSVSAEQVVIKDNVYDSKSTTALATVTKDDTNQAINLGVVNNFNKLCLVRYFTYKEIY